MTIEEFIKAVNTIDVDDRNDLYAYTTGNGDIFLKAFDGCPIAQLEKHYIDWDIRSTWSISQLTIPTKVLKLMVEMAESREEDNEYVIF